MPRTASESLISRVARVLEAFDRETESMSLSTLANRAGLPVPTTHRIVTELAKFGLLERAPDKKIRIGLHLWELSAQHNRGTDIRDAALPFMIDLRAVLQEIVTVAVLDSGSALFLERLAPTETTLEAGRMAERHPIHASSSGLVLLAFASPEYQNHVLSGPLEQRTNETITEPDRLRRLLAEVRQRHFICVPGIGTRHWTGMAVPVFGGTGDVVAALSVVYRLGSQQPVGHAPAMHTAAAGISRALGAASPGGRWAPPDA